MKRVERWIREQLHRGAARLLAGPLPGSAPPDWYARVRRVLVLRYDVMGDLVLSTGLLRHIAMAHPELEVDVLVRTWVAPVLEHFPYARRIIPFNCTATKRYPSLSLLAHVRRQRYDVVIDGMSIRRSSPTSSLMFMIASRAPYRVGLTSTSNSFVYNLAVEPQAERPYAEQVGVLAEPFGIALDGTDWRPQLVITPEERLGAEAIWKGGDAGLRVFVNISVSAHQNDWPDQRFIDVIRALREKRSDVRVLVTGVPGEADRIARVAHAAGARASTQSLRQVMALVATSDLVFTPDTGIIHLAAAFGRPTISLHRPNKWMWSAYRVPSRTLFSDNNDSLQSIGVAEVVAAAEGLIEEQYGVVRA